MPHSQDEGLTSLDSTQDISGPLSIGLETAMVLLNIFPMCVACRLKKSHDRNPTDELIFALSLTDILSVVVPSPLGLTAYFRHQWYGGQRTCNFYQVTIVWFQLASMCLVTYMCLDRWFALVQAMKYKLHVTSHKRTRISVLIIYAFSLSVACLPLFGLAPEALSASGKLCQSWMISETTTSKQHVFYLTFLTTGFGNLLFTVVVNSAILGYLWKFQKQFGSRATDRMSSAAMQIDRRTTVDFTRMILVVTAIFYMAWLPVLVMIALQRIGLPVDDIAVLYAVLSTTLTGLLNPLIYAIFSRYYRQGYVTIVRSTSKFLFGCPLSRMDVINDVASQSKRLKSASTCNSIAALLASGKSDETPGSSTYQPGLVNACYSPLSPDSQRSLLSSKTNSVYDFQESTVDGADESNIDMQERTYIEDIMQNESNIERMSKDIYGSDPSLVSEDSDMCERVSVASLETQRPQSATRRHVMQESII